MSRDNFYSEHRSQPPQFHRHNYDSLNSETFGDGAAQTNNDWEAAHNAFVMNTPREQQQHREQQHHREQQQHRGQHTQGDSSVDEALPEQLSHMKIKKLWPSSPTQASVVDSIWSSPELPPKPIAERTRTQDVIGSPSLPPGGRVMTVEELEHGYVSPSSMSASSEPRPLSPPSNHPLPPPPGLRMPHPPMPPQMMGQGGLMRLPPHYLLGPPRGIPQGFPPPHQHFGPPQRILLPQHMHGFQMMPPQGSPRHPPMPPPSHFHPSHPQPPRMPPAHPGPFSPPHMHLTHQHRMQQQSDFVPRKSRRSEYLGEMKSDGSGFMTQKEKEWVIRIQLLQLQSADPANEDYYYLNYVQRKNSRAVASAQPQTDSSEQSDDQTSQNILTLPHITREERRYKPAEFSGTLGKLSVSSVGAPRKSIEVPVGEGGKDGAGGTVAKKKQALIVIERLYSLVLDLEDLETKALALPEDDRVQMVIKRDEVCLVMFSLLQLKHVDGMWSKSDLALFHQVMMVRKGKRLIKRTLPLLSDSQAQSVLLALLHNLPVIIKKDSNDQVLPELTLSIKAIISILDLRIINKCLETLLEGTSTTSGGVFTSLIRIGQNEFGASLLNELIVQGLTHVKKEDRSNQLENDMDKWHKLSTQICKDVLSHKEQFNTARLSTANLLTSLSSLCTN